VRLLGDLLEHEVVVAGLLRGRGVPVHVVVVDLGLGAVEVGDGDALPAQLHHLVLAELDGVPGVRDEGCHVAGEEVLPGAHADHEWGVAAGADHDVRGVRVHRDQCEGALEPAAHLPHGLGQVSAPRGDRLLEQVGHHLGVGLRAQLVAAALQLGAERREVLDDPVVDHRDVPGAVHVRVRVAVVGRAVGGPPRVAHPGAARRQRQLGQRAGEVGQLAGAFVRCQLAVGEDGHAGRVVASVLEPPQSLDDDVEGRLVSHVSHDPAHAGQPRPSPERHGPPSGVTRANDRKERAGRMSPCRR
jgi:hypothetical protein